MLQSVILINNYLSDDCIFYCIIKMSIQLLLYCSVNSCLLIKYMIQDNLFIIPTITVYIYTPISIFKWVCYFNNII